jgi:tRNA(Ile)-lysidine synthase
VADGIEARLSAATERLIGAPTGREWRFGLAVSGGADSMAMLAAATNCWPGQVEVATVDHGLRPEAGAEAVMVAEWCAARAIAHETLRPSKPIAGNLLAEARTVRYALLEDWRVRRGLDWLLTAHQADDQIETLIMRLNRGAGISGLASVRARHGIVLRPLLGERRATLRAYCVATGVPFVDDPSNDDPRFDRVRLRVALAGCDLIDPASLNRSLDALDEAAQVLDWATECAWAAQVSADGQGLVLDSGELPVALLRMLLLRMLAMINPEAPVPRGPSIDQALVQLFNGKAVALADCVVTGGPHWTVRRAPPRRPG